MEYNRGEGPYYYINSIIKPSSVIAVFTAYLLQDPNYTPSKDRMRHKNPKAEEGDVVNDESKEGMMVKKEIKPDGDKGYTKNLVIVKESSIEVYLLDGKNFDPCHTFEIYAKIWSCMKIPIGTLEGREQDLIYVVTDKMECTLLYFSKAVATSSSKIVIEEGEFPRVNTEDPLMFYYPGISNKIIGSVLLRNMLHLIPIHSQNAEYILSDPAVVVVGHTDIEDLALLNSANFRQKLKIAVIEHPYLLVTNEFELKVYEIESSDIFQKINTETPFNRNIFKKFSPKSRYVSKKPINKIFSMPFGGFLAFDSVKAMYFSPSDYNHPLCSQGFTRGESTVTGVEFLDDPNTDAEDIGFRLVACTELSHLYLIIFDKSQGGITRPNQMSLRYQGLVEGAQGMAYLGEGQIVGGTVAGYKLVELQTGYNTDESPYLKEIGNQEQGGPVTNIQVVDKYDCDSQDLIVTSQSQDCLTYLNIYLNGIALDIYFSDDIPKISYSNSFFLNDKSYLVYNIPDEFRIVEVNLIEDVSDGEEEKINTDTKSIQNERESDNSKLKPNQVISEKQELLYSGILWSNENMKVRKYF